jgi:plastocyanin
LATVGLLLFAAPALADDPVLDSASYPDASTYNCHTDPITIYPGQNLNLYGLTKTCPNAEKVSGPGDAGAFSPGSTAQGYLTRFKPSMVEIHGDGSLTTPSVWDLHLHHVVWLGPGGVGFGTGEEKSEWKMPQGYGFKLPGDATWGLNYMIHNLTATGGRQVEITWQIDWVPETSPARTDLSPIRTIGLDVAGTPHVYPVFDAERGFDTNGDGLYTFPDDVPTDPSAPGYEERENVSSAAQWTVPDGGRTLVFSVGHLHPGGLRMDMQVARDGPDAGSAPGDDPSEIKPLFRSEAHYYEPAGAVSWDAAMTATRPDWRVHLNAGDVVSVNATYDVRKASWYESMGLFPLLVSPVDNDPLAKDPFDDAAAVKAMYDEGGVITHGRLPENIDKKASKDLGLPDPRKLKSKGRRVPKDGLEINGFGYSLGGYSAFRDFPSSLMRPPLVKPGSTVTFTNIDALPTMSDTEQVWHSVTSCSAPCNLGSGIGYPLARGPIKFDSGQLGFGTALSSGVTTQTGTYTTPPLTKPGKTYTYFCRIHPFMRGSIRVAGGGG